MQHVDLNCDMGESFGPWTMGNDETLMQYVTSVNIACGFHAGDPAVMRVTAELALKHGINVGAHPGYPDLQGFGRRSLKMSPREIYDIVLYQISAMHGVVKALGGVMKHVKPHGALYNDAALNASLASAIVMAVRDFDRSLVVFGLAGSALTSEGEKLGLRVLNEAFADRTYHVDGTLLPRSEPGAVITDPDVAATQALSIVKDRRVNSDAGKPISLSAETICIHGDGASASVFARAIYNKLKEHGIGVKSY